MKSWLMCSFVVSGIHVNIHWQPVDLYLRNIYFLLVALLILGRLTAKVRVAPITVACNNNSSHERERPIHRGRIAVELPESLFAQRRSPGR